MDWVARWGCLAGGGDWYRVKSVACLRSAGGVTSGAGGS